MNRIIKVFDLLVFGNIFIGLCSVALVFSTFLLNGIDLKITPSVILVFSSTWFYYNFHHHSHHLDFSGYRKFINSIIARGFSAIDLLFLFLPAAMIVYSLTQLNFPIILSFAGISVFSILYSIPLVKWNGRRRKLRESLLLKLPFLALSWAAVTVLIPLLEQQHALDTGKILGQAIARSFFIYGLCIPFEIRDVDNEKKWGTNTLPVVYGIRITKLTGMLILLVGILLRHLAKAPMMITPAVMVALDLSFFMTIFLIFKSKTNPSKYFCKVYVDGMMVLKFVLVYLAIRLV